jgi:hypothetical protein
MEDDRKPILEPLRLLRAVEEPPGPMLAPILKARRLAEEEGLRDIAALLAMAEAEARRIEGRKRGRVH